MLPEDGFNLDFRGFQHVRRRLPAEFMTVRFQVGFYMNFRKNSMNFCNSVSFESRSTSQATTSLISQWNLRRLKSYSNKLSYWNLSTFTVWALCISWNLTVINSATETPKARVWVVANVQLKSYSNKLSYWNLIHSFQFSITHYSWNLTVINSATETQNAGTGSGSISCWNLTVINSATETGLHPEEYIA